MPRRSRLIALIAAAAFVPQMLQAKSSIQLKSINVELPASGQMFPKGQGSDVADNNCLTCHSVDMVLNQPNMPKAAWEAEVNKMRNVYKAPVDDADIGTIVSYLATIKGTK